MESLDSLDQIATAIGKLKGEKGELLDALTPLVVRAFPNACGGRRRNKLKARGFHQALLKRGKVIKSCLAASEEICDGKGIRWSIKFGQTTHWLIARPEGMAPPKKLTDIVLCDGAPFKEGVCSLDTLSYMLALSERVKPKPVRRGRGRGPSKMQKVTALAAQANGKEELNKLLKAGGGEKGYPFGGEWEAPQVGGFQALLRATRVHLWKKGDLETLAKITPEGKDPYTHSERHRKIWFKRKVFNEQTLPDLLKGDKPCTLLIATSHCADVIELLREGKFEVERE